MDIVSQLIVPFVVGVVIPFLTSWTTARGLPEYWETLLNAALSAAGAALVSISFDGDWKAYLLAFAVTWMGAMRGHYTGLPQLLYSDRVTGKHARLDTPPPPD